MTGHQKDEGFSVVQIEKIGERIQKLWCMVAERG